jgi:hypothetical protein
VEVKADPIKWKAADGRGETQALQHRDALRHEAFTTRLFSRESCFFEDAYRHALAPEHDRERGARDATPSDENIGHLFCFPGAFIERLTLRNFHEQVNIRKELLCRAGGDSLEGCVERVVI